MSNDQQNEKTVSEISLSELSPFPGHPFSVNDDAAMCEMVESVRQYGILVPAIARPREDGGYELISGHRRKRACEIAGIETMPVIVKNLDRDEAIVIMVDSNLQRENILPSERAAAYKMKLEAIKRQAGRPPKENGDQLGHHLSGKKSINLIADDSKDSKTQIQRYIRLTELQPELQQMVDEKKIAFTPAVEISYLKPEEQRSLLNTIESEQATPSLSQAQRMRKMSQSGELNEDSILAIMSEQKKPESRDLTLPGEVIGKFFPKSYTPLKMQETIIKLLESWQKKRQQSHER